MSKFLTVRLSKDSVSEIQAIDAITSATQLPILIKFRCKQVPRVVDVDDNAFIWLGSDNNKGGRTAWIQGLRAFGTVVSRVNTGTNRNDPTELEVEVKVVFSKSVTKTDFLSFTGDTYYWFSDLPVMGVNNYSSQVVQEIDTASQTQDLNALFHCLKLIAQGFEQDFVTNYPALAHLLTYNPRTPPGSLAIQGAPGTSPVATNSAAAITGDTTDEVASELPLEWILALAAKGFLLVSGPSGTGKSRMAREIARAMSYEVALPFARSAEAARPALSLGLVTVGPGWVDSSPLLGFRNPFGMEREAEDNHGLPIRTTLCWDAPPSLLLLLRAIASPEYPHFLVLDEMNLSHVERYFAEFLSLMEANRGLRSGGKQPLLDAKTATLIADTLAANGSHPLEESAARACGNSGTGILLPDNLFIVGTVNVDETTYMFSPKVLDRAHVLEMSAPNVAAYLAGTEDSQWPISTVKAKNVFRTAIERQSTAYWESKNPRDLLIATALGSRHWKSEAKAIADALETTLESCQKILSPVGFGFAYRTINEVYSFITIYIELDDETHFKVTDEISWHAAIDRAVFQKVLPRIHGNRRLIGESLRALYKLFNNETSKYSAGNVLIEINDADRTGFILKKSAGKVAKMISRLEATGHTTFVE